MTITAGIDVGTGAIKAALFEVDDKGNHWLARRNLKIRQRDPLQLATQAYEETLAEAGFEPEQVHYVATTGEGENVSFATGHFYSMTTHGRGALYLEPESRSVLDIGALHGRAIKVDERGKVLTYRMTSQCASGSGQFLENISRYLGIAQNEIGELSKQADDPETVSSICAVLAETDVINMVSRGISAPNILRGIHLSMADRLAKLLRVIKADDGITFLSGGLALDEGLLDALNHSLGKMKLKITARNHPDSPFAGAIGAAIWGAFRYEKLLQSGMLAKAS
ncbi:MAG: 2-hydroxyglutaryl-CoA dehydratase [marine bacterium B5-7]|nr:MAG: 2-hydroxyglutaryl-CoA dehydratase [marine bacterium B5-7]